MRTRGRALTFAAALAAALLVLLPSLALAITAEQIATRAAASPWLMSCTPSLTDITCTGNARIHADWTAVVTPASGQFTKLTTSAVDANGGPMDTTTRNWMSDLHGFACGDPKGATTFVNLVGDLVAPGTIKQGRVGDCLMDGGLTAPGTVPSRWYVTSTFAPLPTPTPTKKPTPKPTAKCDTQ